MYSYNLPPPPNFTSIRTTSTPFHRLSSIQPYLDSPYYTSPPLFTTTQPLSIPQLPHIPYFQHPHIPPPPTFGTPKLELAMFDGPNMLEWLFQADQFFTFYNFFPENRLAMISFYMKGEALCWFKWMYQTIN